MPLCVSVNVSCAGRCIIGVRCLISFIDDKKFLIFRLYSGESFENLDRKQQKATHSEKNIPYRRESFMQKQMLIDFDMEFNRYNEDVLADQHVSKDVVELIASIDSVQLLAHDRSHEQRSDRLLK